MIWAACRIFCWHISGREVRLEVVGGTRERLAGRRRAGEESSEVYDMCGITAQLTTLARAKLVHHFSMTRHSRHECSS